MALLCGGRLSFAGESPGGRVVNFFVKEGALVVGGRGAISSHHLRSSFVFGGRGASAHSEFTIVSPRSYSRP